MDIALFYYYFVAVICPDLTLTNGVVVYNDNTIRRALYSMAAYFCTTAGFVLIGDSRRTCTVSGWDRTAPTCTGEDCRISEAIAVIVN